MMDKLYQYFLNVKGSPKTTKVGLYLLALSSATYLFQFYNNETSLTSTSIEASIGFLGLVLLFKEDYDKGNKNSSI